MGTVGAGGGAQRPGGGTQGKPAVYRLVGKATYKQNNGTGATLTYYQVIGLKDGKLYNINKETMIEAAKRGMCDNVRVQSYNGVDILRGNGININDLVAVNPRLFAKAREAGMPIAQAIRAAQAKQQKLN